jgi:hypothetical protein
MTVYGNQTDWNEFLQRIDDLVGSAEPKLAHFIDYFLKEGGRYSKLQNWIEDKTVELKKGKYSFTNDMLDEDGNPKDRSFLGHIATRVIDEDLAVNIGGKFIDKTFLTNLSKDQIAQENQAVKDLCKQDVYIRIEAFRGEKRTDPFSDSSSEPIPSRTHYAPTKEDCDQAIRQLHDEGRQSMTEQVLDRIEQNLASRGIQLRPHWQIMTEANMKIWGTGK